MGSHQRDVALRIGSAIAACAVLPFALASVGVALMFVVLVAQAPDAFAPEGDPCCSAPQSWGAIGLGAVIAVATITIAALLCTGVVSLAVTCVRERGLQRRTFVRAPIAPLAISAILLPASWIIDSPRLPAKCSTFEVRQRDWHGDSQARWRSAEAIERCRALVGRTADDTRSLLGSPTERDQSGWSYSIPADGRHLRVRIHDDRVTSARLIG